MRAKFLPMAVFASILLFSFFQENIAFAVTKTALKKPSSAINIQKTSVLKPPEPKWSEINKKTRESLVNIICTSERGGLLEPLTGSGVIVDKKGIVLTNAHIAQYFLIKDYPTKNFLNCSIRMGSPAATSYKARLLYMPPTWVMKNFSDIKNENPKGTGENDFAFLEIIRPENASSSLPKEFPAIEAVTRDRQIAGNGQVLVASYPAGFLGGIFTQKDLYITSSVSNILNFFTFDTTSFDLINMGGSPVAQKGASGGAVVNSNENLVGIIVTMTEAKTTDKRELQAVTLAYIERELKKETGLSFQEFIERDISSISKNFSTTTEEALTSLLIGKLWEN